MTAQGGWEHAVRLHGAVLLAALPMVLGGVVPGWAAQAGMIVARPDTPLGLEYRNGVLRPYAAAHHMRLKDRPAAPGAPGLARARTADLALVDEADMQAGCAAGLFRPLNENGAAARCGVPAGSAYLALVWNADRTQSTLNWSDFWDVARYPGKRGLRRGARGNLEIALLADGVAPGDVYGVLGSPDGVARAFRKLDQLRPYLVWWPDDRRALALVETGAVLMTSAPAADVADAQARRKHLALQWQGSLAEPLFWASPLHGRQATAQAFLADPDRATRQQATAQSAYPAGLDKAQNQLRMNTAFWHDHGPDLERRFKDWVDR